MAPSAAMRCMLWMRYVAKRVAHTPGGVHLTSRRRRVQATFAWKAFTDTDGEPPSRRCWHCAAVSVLPPWLQLEAPNKPTPEPVVDAEAEEEAKAAAAKSKKGKGKGKGKGAAVEPEAPTFGECRAAPRD